MHWNAWRQFACLPSLPLSSLPPFWYTLHKRCAATSLLYSWFCISALHWGIFANMDVTTIASKLCQCRFFLYFCLPNCCSPQVRGCPCNICCIAFSITPNPPCIYSSVAHIALIAKAADTISVTSTLSEYLQWDILQQVQCCAESNAISGLVSDTSTSGTALRIRWTEQSGATELWAVFKYSEATEVCQSARQGWTEQHWVRLCCATTRSDKERKWSRWRKRCTLALTRAACLKYYGVIFQAQHEVRWTLRTIKSWDNEDGSRRTFTFRAKQALFY